ncbi:MAG TPA: NAD(P)-dependent oxidoreductase [Ktedonobacteraceae bacterium]|nr:NAD(P)-dependent oxidoreductase [Ktedonobacteraceae bacterium]
MRSVIIVHPDFDRIWPFSADHFHTLWQAQGKVEFLRLDHADRRPVGEIVSQPESVTRLVVLQVPMTHSCLARLRGLRELAISPEPPTTVTEAIAQAGIRRYTHSSEGFWGQSVAEFALALTLCGLRRIPQLHHEMMTNLTPWNYEPSNGPGRPGARGQQFGDDTRFANGTVAGKRVRIVGAGNIASRYASFMHMLGADVAAWDPYASEPCFHRAGSRRDYHLDHLVQDAEIFAPMVPLTETTRGLVTREHLLALPRGCLVMLVTRAGICDMPTLRERVLADEVSLAADVWDVEPLPLDDALLGRHNVVHTPHNAGRTIHANQQWAEVLAMQFDALST